MQNFYTHFVNRDICGYNKKLPLQELTFTTIPKTTMILYFNGYLSPQFMLGGLSFVLSSLRILTKFLEEVQEHKTTD